MFGITNFNNFFYIFFMIIVSIGRVTSGFSYPEDLYEGSQCTTQKGIAGTCKRLQACPPRIADILAKRGIGGVRDRCGFDNFDEIVCCPVTVSSKIGIRPAAVACQEYSNEVESDNEDGLRKRTIGLEYHIVNGVNTDPEKFPFMAALAFPSSDGSENSVEYKCGGALISPRYVLTAAHCVTSIYNTPPIRVRMGSAYLRSQDETPQEINVSTIVTHPEWKRSTLYNDIALVKLVADAEFTSSVRPVCLQTSSMSSANIADNASLIATGYGATKFVGNFTERLMMTGNMSFVSAKDCQESYKDDQHVPRGLDDSIICAIDRDGSSDTCEGDSGGPLILTSEKGHQTVVGLTTAGLGCGGAVPSLYVSVHWYLDWIESHVWPELYTS